MKDIIYRIQDKDGRGPWKPGFARHWIEPREAHSRLIPWYAEFGDIHLQASPERHIGCACTSVDQLRLWFSPSEYQKLIGFGYQAVKMTVDRLLAQSDIQCVFERSRPLRKDVSPFDLYPDEEPHPPHRHCDCSECTRYFSSGEQP